MIYLMGAAKRSPSCSVQATVTWLLEAPVLACAAEATDSARAANLTTPGHFITASRA